MNLSTYYSFQATARGLNSVDDVIRVVNDNTRMYDEIVLPWLPKDPNADIYEAACGPGIFLHWLKRRGYRRAVGTDSSDVQIALARAASLEAELVDSISDLKARAGESLDCVVGLDFYEHLPKEILLDFLAETYRVLRPGGRLILRGPNGDSPVLGRALYNDITHNWALTSIAFNAVFTMFGFDDIEFRDDTISGIQKNRWIKVPAAWIAQHLLRTLLRLATREHIRCLSASMFVCGRKSS